MQKQDVVEILNTLTKEKLKDHIDMLQNNEREQMRMLLDEILVTAPDHFKIKCCEALTLIPTIEAYQTLLKALKCKSWHVRNSAAKGLAVIGKEKAIPDLEKLLQDKAYGVREDVQHLINELKK